MGSASAATPPGLTLAWGEVERADGGPAEALLLAAGPAGHRVERREELPIDDHVLEHPAGQVVPRGRAYARKALRRLAERGEDAPGRVGAHMAKQVGRDPEDRPVVDVPQDQLPCVENAELEERPRFGPKKRDRRDVAASGDGGMDGERVGDDGQSHPAGSLADALGVGPLDEQIGPELGRAGEHAALLDAEMVPPQWMNVRSI